MACRSRQFEGSPPLARGKAVSAMACSEFLRITPACAGKSEGRQDCTQRFEDHPRLRGEKRVYRPFNCIHKGSPPLARGKVFAGIIVICVGRITPACAGKRDFEGVGSPLEKGSPPLARGKGRLWRRTDATTRITPACAGKSKKAPALTKSEGDHPRLRGEKFARADIMSRNAGSPPLARGKVCCLWYSSLVLGDHPRLRGEKDESAKTNLYTKGSPPLARGKERKPIYARSGCRITPACAGKSQTFNTPPSKI